MALLQYIDFEVPSFGEFESADPGATLTQSPGAAFPDRGAVGLRASVADGSAGALRTRAFGDQNSLCIGMWVKVRSGFEMDDGQQLDMVADAAGAPLAVRLRYEAAWQGLRIGLSDASGATYATENLPTDRWVRLAAAVTRHASNGSHALWQDGRPVGSATGLANSGVNNALLVGASNVSSGATIAFDLDEIKIGQSHADVQPWVRQPRTDHPCPERTLIVTRAGDADSEAWGEYYRQARGIPLANWCRVPCMGDEDTGSYANFQAEVEATLGDWLSLNSAAAAHITTVVLGYGVPGRFGAISAASRLTRLGSPPSAGTRNPLYDERAIGLRRVTRAVLDGAGAGLAYMVHRIDAPDLATAKQLVDRSVALESATQAGDGWLDFRGLQGEAFEDALEEWDGSLSRQLLKQPANRCADADPASDAAPTTINHDDWYFGQAPDAGSADFFGTPAGGRAIFIDAGESGCATLRGPVGDSWCPLAIAAGYALAAGGVAPTASHMRLSPWPLFEALRRGMTWAEAFIQAVPELDGAITPVGDPLAVVRFPLAGYHVYRGRDSADAIDYSAPIAARPPAAGEPATIISTGVPPVPGGWPANVNWFLAVRAVDAAGVEYADPQAVVRARFNSAGRLLDDLPAAVRTLSARATSGQRLEAAWAWLGDADPPAPERFDVFVGPAQGQTLEALVAGGPAGSVPASGGGTYRWTSPPLAAGRPWRVAVRAVAAEDLAGLPVAVVAFAQAGRAVNVQQLQVEVR